MKTLKEVVERSVNHMREIGYTGGGYQFVGTGHKYKVGDVVWWDEESIIVKLITDEKPGSGM